LGLLLLKPPLPAAGWQPARKTNRAIPALYQTARPDFRRFSGETTRSRAFLKRRAQEGRLRRKSLSISTQFLTKNTVLRRTPCRKPPLTILYKYGQFNGARRAKQRAGHKKSNDGTEQNNGLDTPRSGKGEDGYAL